MPSVLAKHLQREMASLEHGDSSRNTAQNDAACEFEFSSPPPWRDADFFHVAARNRFGVAIAERHVDAPAFAVVNKLDSSSGAGVFPDSSIVSIQRHAAA